MNLSPFEWAVVAATAGLALGIIGYFLKRTMNRTDTHDMAINEMKRTYVTKDELKEIKIELRNETSKLADDVAEIKEHYIRRDDFYRVTSDLGRDVEKVYNFLIQKEGGNGRGQE